MSVGGLVGCVVHCAAHLLALASRIHFGQISSNQMLLSVIDELRTNTLSKVHKIRVSDVKTNSILSFKKKKKSATHLFRFQFQLGNV